MYNGLMKMSELKFQDCIDDKELMAAVAEITEKLVDKIFISEDMEDAKRDGFTEGIHKVLTDGRVVWLANL